MKITIITQLFFLSSLHLLGQSIEPANFISHSNYHLNVDGISLHASLGEIVTEHISTEEMSLSQGFLQTYFDLVPTEEIGQTDLKIRVGPNPCISHFNIEKNTDESLIAFLFDLQGRMVRQTILTNQRTSIDVFNLPAGSYFLRIQNEEIQIFNTYKIIKS